MNPSISTFSPVPTGRRVETLATRPTAGVAVAVGVAVGGGGVAVAVGVGVGDGIGPSSLVIVPTPWLLAITPLLGSVRLTKKVSLSSGVVSPTTGTVIVLLTSPGANERVPLRAR